MSGAADDEVGVESSVDVLLSASFTAPNNTLIQNYTPEIGPVCLSDFCVTTNATVSNAAPDSYVDNNRMRRGTNFRSPIWQLTEGIVAIQAKIEWSAVQNISLITRLNTPTLTRGCRVVITSTTVDIRSQSNGLIGSVSTVLNSGDTVRLEDDGSISVGALQVFVNGVFLLANTSTTGLDASTGNQVSGYIANDQGYIDDLLVTVL